MDAGPGDGSAAGEVCPFVEAVEPRSHCAQREAQLFGYLLIAEAIGQQQEDFGLAGCRMLMGANGTLDWHCRSPTLDFVAAGYMTQGGGWLS